MKKSLPLRNFLSSMPLVLGFSITPLGVANSQPIKISVDIIEYFSIASSNNTIGKLTFMGGLELSSDAEDFGGFSGLRLTSDGSRFYSVSDNGYWLTGAIQRNKKGQLKRLEATDLSCLCKTNGKPYPSKHWADAEGIEIDGNEAYVVFERLNRINGYAIKNNHRAGPPKQATSSFKPFKVAYNTGLEAMALAPKGSPLAGKFVAIAEESLDAKGHNRAFIASKSSIEEFSIIRSDGYSITDATFLPNGDLLILERRFGLSVGIGIRVRKIASQSIKVGAIAKAETLMEAGLSNRIDNMEGISAWTTRDGETRIAIISDDNYNSLQRTLLLEFKLNN